MLFHGIDQPLFVYPLIFLSLTVSLPHTQVEPPALGKPRSSAQTSQPPLSTCSARPQSVRPKLFPGHTQTPTVRCWVTLPFYALAHVSTGRSPSRPPHSHLLHQPSTFPRKQQPLSFRIPEDVALCHLITSDTHVLYASP